MFDFQHNDERHGVLDESGEVFGFTNKECYFRQGNEAETREKPLDRTHTQGRLQSHTQTDEDYQNTNDFLWFLVIDRDSIDLLQFISNMNQSYHTQTQVCISPNTPMFHCYNILI